MIDLYGWHKATTVVNSKLLVIKYKQKTGFFFVFQILKHFPFTQLNQLCTNILFLKSDTYSTTYSDIIIPLLGSKQDNLLPLLNRKCRAFALNNNNNNEEASKDQDFDDTSETPTLLNNTTTTNKPEQMLDEDEDESPKPDISQIIRSLDTPPPS